MFDIIVVGGGPAGMTAALYCLRAGKSVLVIEKQGFGGQITYSHRVENYPGIKEMSGNEFADKLMEQILAQGAELELSTVEKIVDCGDVKKVITGDGEYEAKAVIVATGATARKLGVPGEEELIGAGVSYCAVCDGAFYKGEDVAVIGGGSTALQDAMFLAAYCTKVYIVHRRDEFRGEKSLVQKLRDLDNVEFVLDSVLTAVNGEDVVNSVAVENVKDGSKREITVKGVFMAVGQEPSTDVVKDILDIDDYGYIDSEEDCKTKLNGIFVAGDCRRKQIRQLTTAVADGSVAALAACEFIS
ncbi:MAG: thioredoxin-disulfide reductase [Lachnospiraceae bacterium]|nr:thioredoxin-disulfide reductase [Lachnospiraceae bacterium]